MKPAIDTASCEHRKTNCSSSLHKVLQVNVNLFLQNQQDNKKTSTYMAYWSITEKVKLYLSVNNYLLLSAEKNANETLGFIFA